MTSKNKLEIIRYIELSCSSIILECDLYRKGIEPYDNIKTRINYLADVVNEGETK